jgi:hypothetical protein
VRATITVTYPDGGTMTIPVPQGATASGTVTVSYPDTDMVSTYPIIWGDDHEESP